MLELLSCSAGYGGKTILRDIELRVERGQTAAIIGASGVGKTTLLNLAAGLIPADRGSVLLGGLPLRRGDSRLSYMPQDFGLFPWLSSYRNVALSLEPLALGPAERRRRSLEALSALGLSAQAHSFPGRLSGGERQRVALARAFVRCPEVLLMDEPFSSLDALTREAMQEVLIERLSGGSVAALLVTHSIEEAAFLGDSVYMLTRPERGGLRLLARHSCARSHAFRASQEYASMLIALRREFDDASR